MAIDLSSLWNGWVAALAAGIIGATSALALACGVADCIRLRSVRQRKRRRTA